MSDAMEKQKQPLISKKARVKMLINRVGFGWWGLVHLALIAGAFLLIPAEWIEEANDAVFMAVFLLILIVPYLVHGVYVGLSKFGYAVFHSGSVEIGTTLKKCRAENGSSLRIQAQSHNVGAKRLYYMVKLTFEQNGQKQSIKLMTDDLTYLDAVKTCFIAAS